MIMRNLLVIEKGVVHEEAFEVEHVAVRATFWGCYESVTANCLPHGCILHSNRSCKHHGGCNALQFHHLYDDPLLKLPCGKRTADLRRCLRAAS